MTKILLVGQEQFARRLMIEELRLEGYQVASAIGASIPLEIIKQVGPHLVIMDTDQAPSRGLDLLQEIRNHHYNLPVILLSVFDIHRQDRGPWLRISWSASQLTSTNSKARS